MKRLLSLTLACLFLCLLVHPLVAAAVDEAASNEVLSSPDQQLDVAQADSGLDEFGAQGHDGPDVFGGNGHHHHHHHHHNPIQCLASEVHLEYNSQPHICGRQFGVKLYADSGCLLHADHGQVCDAFGQNCNNCTYEKIGYNQYLYRCQSVLYRGNEIFTAEYDYGTLHGVISIDDLYSCPRPPCPLSSVHYSSDCYYVQAGSYFKPIISTSSSCTLDSGKPLLCQENTNNCVYCQKIFVDNYHKIGYSCHAPHVCGKYILSSTYILGGVTSVVSTSVIVK